MGSGTDRRGAAREAGDSRLAAHRQALHAFAADATPQGGSQAWRTFVRNHAPSVLACDFFVAVTATFRVVYVFVVLEVGTRRILHWNVTAHPTADWTAQQFRIIVSEDLPHRYVIHDCDSIYSAGG
jgi:hypothetical protein